jgi:cysteine desulfurase NifS/selenium donor protein
MMKPIYLDYNATTPVDPAVAAAMKPFLEENFGNPSSIHWYGIQTKKAVEKARRQVAELLNCGAEEIIFTSGGSESNNCAIKGTAFAKKQNGNHIITSAIEHPAVTEVCKYLEGEGFRITYLPVDEYGSVDPNDVENAITTQTILITIMHANNEVGTIQPIAEIAKIAKAHNIFMHTDAAQSVGKIPVGVDELGVDLLSVAGHKLYAPKGIGALYIRSGVKLAKMMHGADHERNLRAGTENVLEIVGLGKACEIAGENLDNNLSHMQKMRDRLHENIKAQVDEIKLNGHPDKRLPNTLSLSFANIEADTLLSELEGIAASAGAACHSDSVDISPTLQAMNVPLEYAMGTIRFSTGRMTTTEEIDKASEMIVETVTKLKPASSDAVTVSTDLSDIKLTHFTHGLGCACKLRPQALERILKDLPVPEDAKVLVGSNTADDAAVYQIDEKTAIVQTVDFFTPIVDDPYHFGAIAAANAFSDVYAMGGKPLFALNIVAFPSNRLPEEVLKQILQGAQDKAKEAGVSIIGGHTIDDTEPKYGMAVTGLVSPQRVLTNANAQPGDAIILTKPIGIGIISTAIKRGLAEQKTIDDTIALMSTLNRTAAEVMEKYPVNACTDVTGFGLLGHLYEMAAASKLSVEVFVKQVPVLAEAREFAAANVIPGGTQNNLEYISPHVQWEEGISDIDKILLCDAQTSGGLLIALPENEAKKLENELRQNGVGEAVIIGRFLKDNFKKLVVRVS